MTDDHPGSESRTLPDAGPGDETLRKARRQLRFVVGVTVIAVVIALALAVWMYWLQGALPG